MPPPLTRPTGKTLLALALLFAGVCFLCLAAIEAWKDWQGTRSAHWPTAAGTILERKTFQVDPTRSTHPGTYYLIELRYAYEVDGQCFEGNRYDAYDGRVDRATADDALTRYRPGSPCRVAYDPANPASAYIAPGPRPDAWRLAGVMGGVGIVIGVIGVVVKITLH